MCLHNTIKSSKQHYSGYIFVVYSSQKEYQHEMETAPQVDSSRVVPSTIIISTPKMGADVTAYL